MADLEKVLEHVKNAERELKLATEALVPITALKQVESYILGLLRGSLVTVRDARDGIMQSADFKKRKLLATSDLDNLDSFKG